MRSRGESDRSSRERQPHIVAVCGSRRSGGYTRQALQESLSGVEAAGGTAELLDLMGLDLPPLDPDVSGAGDSDMLRHAIRGADAVLLGTPTYHGSYSGAWKNTLDHCGAQKSKILAV